MKYILRLLTVMALAALAAGCSSIPSKEDTLVASGFKVIVPKTAAQQRKLKALPAGRVTMVQKQGKTYYVFPDFANDQAYVGGPKQYQVYLQTRQKQRLADEQLEAAEMNWQASMDWDAWGGWGGWGPGWY
jgi:hypothetical protein